jgi:GWxTD domain-containing protein
MSRCTSGNCEFQETIRKQVPEKGGLSSRGNKELTDRGEIRMSQCHAFQSKGLAILILLILYSTSCSLKTKIKHDPFYKNFYEKARVIMTEEEIKIYNLFSDKNSKKEFIENFWRIRDPNPSTVENEALSEFQRRIAYASKWFVPYTPGAEFNTGQGWNTNRGRAYLIFGEPDKMVFGGSRDMWIGRRNRASDSKYGMERWYYYDYGIRIFFLKDEHSKWKLVSLSQQVLEAMKTAKLNMVSPELRVDVKRMLKFEGEFENSRIILRIPT